MGPSRAVSGMRQMLQIYSIYSKYFLICSMEGVLFYSKHILQFIFINLKMQF